MAVGNRGLIGLCCRGRAWHLRGAEIALHRGASVRHQINARMALNRFAFSLWYIRGKVTPRHWQFVGARNGRLCELKGSRPFPMLIFAFCNHEFERNTPDRSPVFLCMSFVVGTNRGPRAQSTRSNCPRPPSSRWAIDFPSARSRPSARGHPEFPNCGGPRCVPYIFQSVSS